MEPKSKRLPMCWHDKSNKRYNVLIRELLMAHLSSGYKKRHNKLSRIIWM